MSLTKTKTVYHGICCDSCQEDVNLHRCAKCNNGFEDGEVIYCKYDSHMDCEHYHDGCEPKDG